MKGIRKLPPVCLIISIIRLLTGRLRISKKYIDNSIRMENGKIFVIFRHITIHPLARDNDGCVFIVSFKFARLSHKLNKLTSIIPMLLISGYPGFVAKIYAVNPNDGFWQGMYQWKSIGHLEEYKRSFVFKMMNKRAIPETKNEFELPGLKLTDFIENKFYIPYKNEKSLKGE